MRKTITILGVAAAITTAGATNANADSWHFVKDYGTSWTGCHDHGQRDVRAGYAGAYDCRTVGTAPARYHLWEA
ncbi:hypothetical protein WEH80_38520 [Actinomycetes bacterium KLBMP 9759]